MSDTFAMPLGDDNELEATGGGNEEIRWVIVERTAGLLPAQIIADRLVSEGIPARAWQEGAGRALGLVVGILGNGHVVVPEEFEAKARAILEQAGNEEILWQEEYDADEIAEDD